jgi:hypothetical protein
MFIEPVAAPAGTWTRRAQEFWTLISHLVSGCNPTRETGCAIEQAGFSRVDDECCAVAAPLGLTVPHIVGTALT